MNIPRVASALLLAAGLLLPAGRLAAQGFVVDHTTLNLNQIPASAITQAKTRLRIAYGHTSHGSQLVDGMGGLVGFMNRFPADAFPDNLFAWESAFLTDYAFSGYGASDLGAPDYVAWEAATRSYLADHPETNVVIWSWCGQVSGASAADISNYLALMSGLETSFPAVRFVYMTGHLDRTGASGNLNLRNEQIRTYCRANDKVLYDFADIESFDPDGTTNFMALGANDACNYRSNGTDRNWAQDWQNSHTLNVDWYSCSAAHTEPLNGNRKAYAAWWLWTRLAGWAGPNPDTTAPSVPSSLRTTAVASGRVDLAWDASTDAESGIAGYRVYRGGMLLGQVTTLTHADTTAVPNTAYSYTITAVNGAGLASVASPALAVTTPADTTAPAVPANLAGGAASSYSIALTWSASTDNVAVASYRVYRDGGLVGSPTAPGFTDTGLNAGTTYAYTVAAVDTAGNASAPCTPVNIATPSVDLEAPSTPTGLAGGAASTTTITLTWNASTDNVGVTGYRVYRNGGSTPVGSPTATGFTDSGLSASTTYAYRVATIDAAGNLSAQCDAVNVRTLDPSAQEYTATLTGTGVIDDTFLYASSPTTNYGATRNMSTTDRFLIRFDLAPYANKRIVSAQLSFYVWSQTNWQADQYLDLYRVTRGWTELQANWNIASTGVPWTTAGGADVPGDHAELVGRILQTSGGDHVYYPVADVTALVQKWAAGTVPNFGLLLVNASLTQIGLKASEYSPGPQLVITYTDEPVPYHYGMWVHSRFTDAQLANPALEATVWGTGADPDGDGTINLFEHALGTDPNSAAGNAATALRCLAVAGSTDLQLTFKRVKGLQDVATGLECSTDIAAWSAVPDTGYTETATDCGCGLETVVWRFAPASDDDCGFYRIRLQAP